MMVLSRKVGGRILIGGNIVMTVIRIGPNAVRLGIEAPKDMNIVREELVDPDADDCGAASFRAGGGTLPIQVSSDDLNELGRRPRSEFLEADEVADAYVESEMIDHGC